MFDSYELSHKRTPGIKVIIVFIGDDPDPDPYSPHPIWFYETPDGAHRGVASMEDIGDVYAAIGLPDDHNIISVPRTGIEPMLPD